MISNDTLQEIVLLSKGKHAIKSETAELLYNHGCYSLLLNATNQSLLSTKARKKQIIHHYCLMERLRCCHPIWSQLILNNIPFAVIKGAVLSQAAYNDPDMRISGDIDMLIRREDIALVKSVLFEYGFVQGRIVDNKIIPTSRKEALYYSLNSHQLAPFLCSTENKICPYVSFDINTDIFWGEFSGNTDMSFVLSETESANILQHDVRKLQPEMEFISLCLHVYKDMNSIYLLWHRGINISQYCDLYYYWINARINKNKLLSLCAKLKATPYVYYCLYHINELFSCERISRILPSFFSHEGQMLTNCYGLTSKSRKQWNINFKDRILCNSLQKYLSTQMNDDDWKIIRSNDEYI